MKKFKSIVFIFFIVAILVVVIYTTHKITANYYKKINIAEQKQSIIEKNTIKQKADIENDNKQAIIDSLKIALTKANELSYAEPPKTDNDITPVDVFEEFVHDIIPDLPEVVNDIIEEDTRKAITYYKYRDAINNYGVDIKTIYQYNSQEFVFEPLNVIYEPQKNYPFAVGIYLTTNESIGSWIDWDLWRVRLGVSAGVSIKMELEGRARLGFKL